MILQIINLAEQTAADKDQHQAIHNAELNTCTLRNHFFFQSSRIPWPRSHFHESPSLKAIEHCLTFRKLIILVVAILLAVQAAGGTDHYELKVTKEASVNEVSPGDWINYTISCRNTGSRELTGVQIMELYPLDLEVNSTFPAPDTGTDNQWTVNYLPPGATRTITVNCKLVKCDAGFSFGGRVEGTGFLRINNYFTNRFQSGTILNQVIATSDQTDPTTASFSAQISPEFAEVKIKKSGSGAYTGQEESKIGDGLSYQDSYVSSFEPSCAHPSADTDIAISSRWRDDVSGKNRMAGLSISEDYYYATSMDRSLRLRLEQNSTSWETNSEFVGMGHVGLLQKSDRSSSVHASRPVLESENDFIGKCKINNSLEGHNTKVIKIDINQVPSSARTPQVMLIIKTLSKGSSSIYYLSSASGTGLVSGLDMLGSSQLISVSGTGDYESSAAIRTQDSYLARSQNLLHRPSSFMIAESGVWCNQSLKWASRIWSGDNKNRFMGAEISSANRVNETVEILGLNYINLDMNFSGQANLRTVYKGSEYGQDYLGNYSIKYRISQKGLSKYNQPHLSLGAMGRLLYLPNCTLAEYAIEIENDGNSRLKQVDVLDLFPVGAEFINSTLEFSELTSSGVKWTVDLGMGQGYYIVLLLDVTKSGSDLKNFVSASCEDSGLQVINATILAPEEVKWPSECRMIKSAWLDQDDKRLIWYSIIVSNLADINYDASLRDALPPQTALINSSVDPEAINDRVIIWSFQLQPYENWTVVYRMRALDEESLINYAQVELRPPDGSPISVAYAEAKLQVGSAGVYSSGEWRPPDWGWDLNMDDSCNLTSSCYLKSDCGSESGCV